MYHANMKLESSSREEVSELLRAHGITPTQQRIEIALVLFGKRWHPSADEILAAVNARYAKTSKATVYNTLKLFLDKGLVRDLIVDPNKVFYDSNTSVHHHFYDVTSGEITDIPAAGVRIDGLPPLPAGMVTDGIDIVVRTRPGL
jgi:Fur family transcriptional regulator, iron response regulator